jgi:Leucine-rich repeat (LRR) protein
LDLSPDEASAKPYDPYYEEEEEEQDEKKDLTGDREAAHAYASSLLASSSASGFSSQRSPFHRTIKLQQPSSGGGGKHLVRKLVLRRSSRPLIALLVVTAIVIFSVAIAKSVKNKRNRHGNSGDSPSSSSPYAGTGVTGPEFEAVVDMLASSGVSKLDDLRTEGTPQNLAADWIANVDALPYVIPNEFLSDPYNSPFVQRYVLATFYFAMGGPDWEHNLDFISNEHECGWYNEASIPNFVTEEYAVGVGCDTNLKVRSLFIPQQGLTGTLPSELQFLPYLDMLGLPGNAISGPIPTALSTMSNLIYLNLNYNELTGEIPEFLGDFAGLEVLGLSNNQLEGRVPASLGTLSYLKTLSLDDNMFTGSLDFAKHLENLEYFYADRNQFTGHVDTTFLQDLFLLRQLDVSDNALTGTEFPSHFFDFPNLHTLDLAKNQLRGQLPNDIPLNLALQYLSLRDNEFDGPIPFTIDGLQALSHLDLHGNGFSGEIPNTLGHMYELTYLFLGNNVFTGELPPMSQLEQLRELSLTKLGLEGAIPSWLHYLTALELLDLSYNNLSDGIPESIWILPNLSYLLLHNNNLSGNVPVTGGENLKVLALHHNQLTGSVDHVCDLSDQIEFMGTDCNSIQCSESCCSSCCQADDEDCFVQDVADYMDGLSGFWELGYERSSFSVDPDILDEAGLFQVVSADPND